MIEVEVKLELSAASWPRVQERLLVMRFIDQLRNSDVYYDTAQFDLLRQGVFVRVRNHRYLEFKYNEQPAPAHLQSKERKFSLELLQVQEMNSLFSRFIPCWCPVDTVAQAADKNGLLPLARIQNSRSQYTSDNLLVCVDQVEGLGNFLEIEIQCEEGSDTRQAEADVLRLAADFAARPLRVGYVELWLQKHNPLAYQCGKYRQE